MSKRFFGWILTVYFLVTVLGCHTDPKPVTTPTPQAPAPRTVVQEVVVSDTLIPFTVSTLQRIQRLSDADVKKFQFILSGRISLEKDYIVSQASVGNEGRANLNIIHKRDIVTINDQTRGVVIAYETRGNEVILSVCFEEKDDQVLKFSSREDQPDAYFYLSYNPDRSTTSSGDEKGFVFYGGEGEEYKYKLRYADEKPPYLLVSLTQKESDSQNPRTAPGRKVE
jgi:hypothetical protein